ncbi:hypothetical protein HBI95_128210 [Parastagonospora nodorum]|nr:hypothetical protein HBI95_128210 [Parastagonospora nodorum]KAH5468929.1 hypothetical protein HBI28_178570 [Parastagonospora nodorum]KAH5632371.1 hypothetical protein HBI22_113080 [Parastagonospora nodorum]KAH6296908.1 hypothetical protein HBI39_149910 [Parastagonospora nodorum]
MQPPITPFSGQEFVPSSKEKIHLNSIPPSATLNLRETPSENGEASQRASSCDTWFKARIPGFTSPSFKSFAITRAYMIKVKICIGIGGKKFEHEVKSDVEMDSTPEYYPNAAWTELAKRRKDNRLKTWEQKSRWLWRCETRGLSNCIFDTYSCSVLLVPPCVSFGLQVRIPCFLYFLSLHLH